MTIDEILTRDEGQSFDRKSIRIDAKGLAVPIEAKVDVFLTNLGVKFDDLGTPPNEDINIT